MPHHRTADFEGWWGGRRNGWQWHPVIFDANVTEVIDGESLFSTDAKTGTITVLRDGAFSFECWSRGRAPWDNIDLGVVKDMDYGGSGEWNARNHPSFTKEWRNNRGHIRIRVSAKKGDRFNLVHMPAHIQGFSAIFQLKVEAAALNDNEVLRSMPDDPQALQDVASSSSSSSSSSSAAAAPAAPAVPAQRAIDDLVHATTMEDGFTAFQPLAMDGKLPLEELSDIVAAADPALPAGVIADARTSLCLYRARHASQPQHLPQNHPRCFLCKAALSDEAMEEDARWKQRIEAEDQAMFTPPTPPTTSSPAAVLPSAVQPVLSAAAADSFEERAAAASHKRAVTVAWLVLFTEAHDCWEFPTWRVMQQFVQPATAFARCRFVDLPGVRGAAHVGPADVFLSHCWGAKWGTLVAAAAAHLAPSVRVWIDLFAVRQWPGNGADLDFRGVIRRCGATLVVVEGIERVGELPFSQASVGVSSLLDHEKKMLPFMRIWCLCEIHETVTANKNIAICCGRAAPPASAAVRSKSGSLPRTHGRAFESSVAHLYNMQFFADVESAEASFPEDRDRILAEVAASPGGFTAVNSVVRGAIGGSLVSSRCPALLSSVLGAPDAFDALCRGFSEASGGGGGGDPDGQQAAAFSAAASVAAAGGYLQALVRLQRQVPPSSPLHVLMEDLNGMNALHHASYAGHLSTVEWLLGKDNMKTPAAAASPNDEAVRRAMKADRNGRTPLMYATEFNHEAIALLLLARAQELGNGREAATYRGGGGLDALALAAQSGALAVGRALLAAARACGVAAEEVLEGLDCVGYTPLRHAAAFQHVNFVRWLVEEGADVNRRDNWSETILFWAIKGNNHHRRLRELVQVLLAAGCDPNLCGLSGHFAGGTALDRAQRKEGELRKKDEEKKASGGKGGATAGTKAATKAAGDSQAADFAGVVADLRAAGGETLGEQLTSGSFRGLLESDVEVVRGTLGTGAAGGNDDEGRRAAAGLALVACKGRLDVFAEKAQQPHLLPEPGDVVSLDAIRKIQSGDGLVHPGPDWVLPPSDARWPRAAFVLPGSLAKVDVRKHSAEVVWPLAAPDESSGLVWVRGTHSIGGPGPDGAPRYELVYAPYKACYY